MDAPLLPALPGYDNPQLIAHGTTALVFRATQHRLNRLVAIKVITVDTGSVPVNAARELATTVALSSQPHIVSIIDTGITDDDRPYIVMEYCEGGSYAQILRQRGPLPIDDVIEVGVKIGEALHAAHEAGIVHRDVKPSNVLRGRFGPALTDFGIARAPDELSSTLTREMMTPHHASPEALLHQAQSGLSDVYSLASTMWTLLIGHPPFVHPNKPPADMYAFRDRVLHDPLPAMTRDDVPGWLVAELARAMEKLPSNRHASALDFAECIRRGSLGLGPAPARDPGAAGRGQVHVSGLPAAAWPVTEPPAFTPTATGFASVPLGSPSAPAASPPQTGSRLPSYLPADADSSAGAGAAGSPPAGPVPPGPVPTGPAPTGPVQPGPVPSGPVLGRPVAAATGAGSAGTPPAPPAASDAPLGSAPTSAPPARESTYLYATPPASVPASATRGADPAVSSAPPVYVPPSRVEPAIERADHHPTPAVARGPGEGAGWAATPSPTSGGGWLGPVSNGNHDEVETARQPGTRRFADTDLRPTSSRRNGLVVLLVTVAVLGVAVGSALVLAQAGGSARPEASGPGASVGSTSAGVGVTGEAGAPTNVKVTRSGTTVTVTWTDPTAGTVPFIIGGSGPDGERLTASQVRAGETSTTFEGLSASKRYCFVVGALYAVDRVARAPSTCTT